MEFFVYKFQTYYECYNLFLPLKFREIIIIMYFVQFHEFQPSLIFIDLNCSIMNENDSVPIGKWLFNLMNVYN